MSNSTDLSSIIEMILTGSDENQIIEFKKDNTEPQEIGKNISALANSATLYDSTRAYIIWGIQDQTKAVIGTYFLPDRTKCENQYLHIGLKTQLSNNADFNFHEVNYMGKNLVLLIIEKAHTVPVKFKRMPYIRVGSSTTFLSDYPGEEKKIFRLLENSKPETFPVMHSLTDDEVLEKLDIAKYYFLTKNPTPTNKLDIMNSIVPLKIVTKQFDNTYSITTLGALLFAKKLSDFETLSRKSIRVIQYEDDSKISILKSEIFNMGYALLFDELIRYITALIPTAENITEPIRQSKTAYPLEAIREIVANALIHQDLFINGTSPVIEVFDNRIEVTNPGESLVNVDRIIDCPPISRNESLAKIMRQMGVCEEIGTGWDRIAFVCEIVQLPAPSIRTIDNFTHVILYQHIPFKDLTKEERLRTIYLHACLKYVRRDFVTNTSLRERFGLEKKDISLVSRLIKEAVDNKWIVAVEENSSSRQKRYLPYWSARSSKY